MIRSVIGEICNISNVCDGTGGWPGGRVTIPIIIPLRGPSCKLRLFRFSAKLKFQDGPSVAINIFVHEGKVCLQDRCADMEKVDYPRIISSYLN